MNKKEKKEIKKELETAVEALASEIEAVRENPSEEVLFQGVLQKAPGEDVIYRFEATNPALQYAEEFKAQVNGNEYKASPVETTDKYIDIGFKEDFGESIDQVHLEWENDYILKKKQGKLLDLKEAGEAENLEPVRRMLYPHESEAYDIEPDIKDDGSRNDSQRHALKIAMNRPVAFVWGPPGTGKTATLGYMIANHIYAGNKVLFTSNTNRAVDVGMLSILEALQQTGEYDRKEAITRFGDVVLESEELAGIHFQQQFEQAVQQRKLQAGKMEGLINEYRQLLARQEEEALDKTGEARMEALRQRLGMEDEDDEPDLPPKVDDLELIRQKQVVGTTLAQVAVSELIDRLSFDVVVIDEASMAGMPFMLLLAARANKHLIVVGDPMQLPPIAMTKEYKARDYLEQDIYSRISSAKSPADLFAWHDQNKAFTAFFDTQYRLGGDLAGVISRVFYEGRLKTGEARLQKDSGGPGMFLIDTSHQKPYIVKSPGERGFRPENEVHMQHVADLVNRLMLKDHRKPEDIGIIVPFRSVVWALRKYLRSAGMPEVEVGTIHTFQGRERPVILFDTIMSGERTSNGERHYSVRPFDEEKNGLSVPRLLNVAFSRSRDRLLVLADMNHIRRVYGGKFLGRLLDEIEKTAGATRARRVS